MNTRSSKLSLAAILDTSIGRLHVLATVIMTVHLQPPMEFADCCFQCVNGECSPSASIVFALAKGSCWGRGRSGFTIGESTYAGYSKQSCR